MKFINVTSLTFIFSILSTLGFIFFFYKGLYFVDSARYADIARNISEGGKFTSSFTLSPLSLPSEFGWEIGIPPVYPLSISLFFKLLGVYDSSVVVTSITFFLISVPLVYLIARRIFNGQVAIFSSLFYLFTPQLLNYAKDGASEPIFIFELLLITYLIIVGKKWSLFLSGLILGLSFFTKLQSYLFAIIFLVWVLLLYRHNFQKFYLFLIGPVLIIVMNKFGLLFNGSYQLKIPLYLSFQQSSLYPGDNLPRSGQANQIGLMFVINNLQVLLSKIAYNLYNFYKSIFTFDNLLPAWTSPLVVISYLLSHINFLDKEKSDVKAFRIVVLSMVAGSLLLAAVTSPHIRYLHFVLPFIIILAVSFLHDILRRYHLSAGQISLVLILILSSFMIFPLIGTTGIDARFRDQQFNTKKPLAQKVLGEKLGELTGTDEIVVTNLDTWGSWYGKTKTVMMPVDFEVLQKIDQRMRINTIFLTDFQRGNEDHPLSGDWGVMFDDPARVTDQFMINNFQLVKEGTVSAQEVYDNKPFTYKLWIRK